MKRTLLALLLALAPLIAGCRCETSQETANRTKVVVIDGCEYLTLTNSSPGSNSYSFAITHKGNCKNPIHRHGPAVEVAP